MAGYNKQTPLKVDYKTSDYIYTLIRNMSHCI